MKLNEMAKLEKYLIEKKIRYQRIDKEYRECGGVSLCEERHQVIVYDNDGNRTWDAICQPYSYGYEEGLLEVMGREVTDSEDGVEGYLSAAEIIRRLEERNAEQGMSVV